MGKQKHKKHKKHHSHAHSHGTQELEHVPVAQSKTESKEMRVVVPLHTLAGETDPAPAITPHRTSRGETDHAPVITPHRTSRGETDHAPVITPHRTSRGETDHAPVITPHRTSRGETDHAPVITPHRSSRGETDHAPVIHSHRDPLVQLNVSIPLTVFQTPAPEVAQPSHSPSEHRHHKKHKKIKKHHHDAIKRPHPHTITADIASSSSYQPPVEPKVAPLRLQVPKTGPAEDKPMFPVPVNMTSVVTMETEGDGRSHKHSKHHKHKDKHHHKRARVSDTNEINQQGQGGTIESTRGKTSTAEMSIPKPKRLKIDASLTEEPQRTTLEHDTREVTPLQIQVPPGGLWDGGGHRHKKKKKKHKHTKPTGEDFTWEIIPDKMKYEATPPKVTPPSLHPQKTLATGNSPLPPSSKTTPTKHDGEIIRPPVQPSPGKQMKGFESALKAVSSSAPKTTSHTPKHTAAKLNALEDTKKSKRKQSLQPLTSQTLPPLTSQNDKPPTILPSPTVSSEVEVSRLAPPPLVQAKIKTPQVKLSENALKFFLKNLHHLIQKRDTESVFSEAVTDDIAPNYSSIITQPVDLAIMAERIENNHYPSVNEFKDDFVLMCGNAMTYNAPETVYYSLARQLLNTGLQIIAKETSLRPDILHGKLASAIDRGQSASPLPPNEFRVPPPTSVRLDRTSPFLCQLDLNKLCAHPDLVPAGQASAMEDYMNIDISDVGEIRDQSHLTKLTVGVEDDRVVGMDLEESSSEVLAQVSEAAESVKENLDANKPGSKFCFFNQGEDGRTMLNILDPDTSEGSLQQFVKGTGSFVSEMAEAVLNGLTNNRHSKFVDKLKGPSKEQKTTDKVKEEPKETSVKETSETSHSTASSPLEKDGVVSPVQATKEVSPAIEDSLSETPPTLNSDASPSSGHHDVNHTEESRSSFQEPNSRVESRLSSPLSDLVNNESVRSTPSLYTEDHEGIGDVRSSGSPRSVSGTPATGRTSRASSNSDRTSLDSDGNKPQGGSSRLSPNGHTPVFNKELVDVDTRLQRTSDLLAELQQQQNSRLSLPPRKSEASEHIILPGPSQAEVETAAKVRGELATLTAKVYPGDVVTVSALHQAMGITVQQGEEERKNNKEVSMDLESKIEPQTKMETDSIPSTSS